MPDAAVTTETPNTPAEAPAQPATQAATPAEAPAQPAKAAPKPANQVGYALRKERAKAQEYQERATKAEAEITRVQSEQAAKIKELSDQLDRFKSAPLIEGSKAGADMEKQIRDFVEQGAPERLIADLQRQVADERQARLQEKAEREASAKAWQEQEQAKMEHQTILGYTNYATQNATKYPHLISEFSPEEIQGAVAKGYALAKSGQLPPEFRTVEPFLQMLESQAKQVYTLRQQQREKLGLAPQGVPVTATEKKKNGQALRQTSTETPQKGKSGTESKAPPKGLRSRNLETLDEQTEADLAILRAATAKDAADRSKTNGKPAAKS